MLCLTMGLVYISIYLNTHSLFIMYILVTLHTRDCFCFDDKLYGERSNDLCTVNMKTYRLIGAIHLCFLVIFIYIYIYLFMASYILVGCKKCFFGGENTKSRITKRKQFEFGKNYYI